MKALIIANGKKPPQSLFLEHVKDAALILAVDGAAAVAREYRIRPDALIGDLDSVSEEDLAYIEEQGVPVIRLKREKDDTDTVAAFDEALRRGADEITILGALGHRFDHSYANVMLLVRALKRGIKAVITDGHNTLFAAAGEVVLHGRRGDIVSVLPLSEGMSADASCGLKYPLQNLPLPLDYPVGVSNEMTGDTAGLVIKNGIAVIAVSKD